MALSASPNGFPGGFAVTGGLDASGVTLGVGARAVPLALRASSNGFPGGFDASGVPLGGARAVPKAASAPPSGFP